MRATLQLNTSSFLGNLKTYEDKVHRGLQAGGDTIAKQAESYAKQNAVWKDRTGNARQGLTGLAGWDSPTRLSIAVMHTVSYGPSLELAHQKRYAILQDAIRTQKENLVSMVQGVLG